MHYEIIFIFFIIIIITIIINILFFIISSMVEYFSFINLLSWFLFIFIIFFSIVIISTLLYYSTVNFNRGNFNLSIVEFISTLFSFFFLILIIPPALIILFDFDVIIIPTFILYSPGLQWSRHCHILFLPRHIGFDWKADSTVDNLWHCDHYIAIILFSN